MPLGESLQFHVMKTLNTCNTTEKVVISRCTWNGIGKQKGGPNPDLKCAGFLERIISELIIEK